MTLWDLEPQSKAKVKSLKIANQQYRDRIADIGLQEDMVVTCSMKTSLGAPRVFQLGSSTFAIEKEVGELIFVETEKVD